MAIISFLPLFFLTLLSTLFLISAIHQLLWYCRRTRTTPPGNVGYLPFIGETLSLISAYKTSNPEPFMDARIRRYGRVFTTHIFGEQTIFSADPELNKLILSEEGRRFNCSYPSSITTLLGPHSLLLTLVGERHKRFHKMILSRFGTTVALRDSGGLIRDIDRLVRGGLVGWGEGKVRLLEEAKKITFELTVKQLMSEGPGEWMEELRRHYLRVIDGFFSVALPEFIPFTAYARAVKAREEVAETLRRLLRRRKDEKQRNVREDVEKDMIDELLVAEEEGLVSSEEEMVDFLVSLLVAGYETTSTIMTLAVKFLTDTPAALGLLRAEQEHIFARKKDESDPLDWKDYKSMPFTQCVINETLRMANVVGGVFRRAVTDVQFKGYTIPKGSKVFASFRAVHMEPDYYADARTFNPWRWEEKDAPQQTGVSSGIFTPFGGGPRWCPGAELSRVEISIFLHYLVTHFSWEPAEKDELVFFPTTRTRKGYPINIRRRRNLL